MLHFNSTASRKGKHHISHPITKSACLENIFYLLYLFCSDGDTSLFSLFTNRLRQCNFHIPAENLCCTTKSQMPGTGIQRTSVLKQTYCAPGVSCVYGTASGPRPMRFIVFPLRTRNRRMSVHTRPQTKQFAPKELISEKGNNNCGLAGSKSCSSCSCSTMVHYS